MAVPEELVISDSADEADHVGLPFRYKLPHQAHPNCLLTAFKLSHLSRGVVNQIYEVQSVMLLESSVIDLFEPAIRAQITFAFRKNSGPIKQVPKSLVIREGHTSAK